MAITVRSIRINGNHFDVVPKIICDACGNTIELSGKVCYKHLEPYAEKVRFYHSGKPCFAKRPHGWYVIDLAPFMVHFTRQFSKLEKKIPLRLAGTL